MAEVDWSNLTVDSLPNTEAARKSHFDDPPRLTHEKTPRFRLIRDGNSGRDGHSGRTSSLSWRRRLPCSGFPRPATVPPRRPPPARRPREDPPRHPRPERRDATVGHPHHRLPGERGRPTPGPGRRPHRRLRAAAGRPRPAPHHPRHRTRRRPRPPARATRPEPLHHRPTGSRLRRAGPPRVPLRHQRQEADPAREDRQRPAPPTDCPTWGPCRRTRACSSPPGIIGQAFSYRWPRAGTSAGSSAANPPPS
jgi:hypothetical protein